MTPHHARKRFGQHFLHDSGIIERILRSLNPAAADAIVEIGPGLGALTRPLLERVDVVQAIEIDRDVIPLLRERCAGAAGHLTVHQADALAFDFRTLGQDLRLVGNLPYNISTPLLFHLLDQADAVRDMHFMLQREVVDRMGAAAGEPAYGRLSVTLAARARVQPLFRVGRGAFNPPPKVESAMVRVTPQAPDFPLPRPRLFDQVVSRAFSQRRKTLANALKGLADASDLQACDIDPRARAERVSPAEFARLTAHLHEQSREAPLA